MSREERFREPALGAGSVRLDGDDARTRIRRREVHDAEGARLEPCGIGHVRAEGSARGQRDLSHDLGEDRAVAAEHRVLARPHPLADHAPHLALLFVIAFVALAGLVAMMLLHP